MYVHFNCTLRVVFSRKCIYLVTSKGLALCIVDTGYRRIINHIWKIEFRLDCPKCDDEQTATVLPNRKSFLLVHEWHTIFREICYLQTIKCAQIYKIDD